MVEGGASSVAAVAAVAVVAEAAASAAVGVDSNTDPRLLQDNNQDWLTRPKPDPP